MKKCCLYLSIKHFKVYISFVPGNMFHLLLVYVSKSYVLINQNKKC